MSDTRVPVAMLGCGQVAERHARAIGQVPALRLAAVCDVVPARAAALAARFDVPFFDGVGAMLAAVPEVALVSVLTPSALRFGHVSELLERYGRGVVLERPAFLQPSDLLRAYARADALGLPVFPVFPDRHSAAVRRVRGAVLSGALGPARLVSALARWCGAPCRSDEVATPRSAPGDGPITEQLVRLLDLLQYLGGAVTRVSAVLRGYGDQGTADDTVVATLVFATGAAGTLEVTCAAPPSEREVSLSLVCERGLARIGGAALDALHVFSPDPAACAPAAAPPAADAVGDGYVATYQDIGAALRDGAHYPVGRADALASLQVLHAVYRSAETGGRVTVGPESLSSRGAPYAPAPPLVERGAPYAPSPTPVEVGA